MTESPWTIEIRPESEKAWELASETARSSGEALVGCTVTFTQRHPPGPLNREPVADLCVQFELAPIDRSDIAPGVEFQECWSQSLNAGRPVEASDFENVPWGSLLAQAIEGSRVIRTHRGRIKFEADLTDAERQALEDRRRAKTRTPQKGQPVTDEQLRHVAELYLHRVATGSRRPTQDLADMLDIPRPTVARWLVDARKRGLLSQGRRDQETP